MNNDNDYYNSDSFFTHSPDKHALPEWADIKALHTGVWNMLWTAVWNGRKVVLKSLMPQYSDSIPHHTMLRKEYEISRTLSHPGIAATLGFEEVPGIGTCIISEFITGCTLKSKIEEGGYTRRDAITIIKGLCLSVDYLHSMGIVHRDLKPSNIMLMSDDLHVKLIDFGVSDSESFTTGKTPMGTRRYAAPEQLEPGNTSSPASDIFAIGKIMEELFAPFGRQYRRTINLCTHTVPTKRPKHAESIPDLLKRDDRQRIWKFALMSTVPVAAIAVAFFLPHNEKATIYSVKPPVTQVSDSAMPAQSLTTVPAETVKDNSIPLPGETEINKAKDTEPNEPKIVELQEQTFPDPNPENSEVTEWNPFRDYERELDNLFSRPGERITFEHLGNGHTYEEYLENGDTVKRMVNYQAIYIRLKYKRENLENLYGPYVPSSQQYSYYNYCINNQIIP